MKYGKIDAEAHKYSIIESDDWDGAKRMCGLVPLKTDHGYIVHRAGEGGIGILVAEFGLFEPCINQHFFAIGGRLFAGNALLYAYDGEGNTIDIGEADPVITWFDTAYDAERAIAAGIVVRPEMRVNGAKVWEWPAPKPDWMEPKP